MGHFQPVRGNKELNFLWKLEKRWVGTRFLRQGQVLRIKIGSGGDPRKGGAFQKGQRSH